ncbi:MAG: hypothetical protein OQJ97_04215 [Rhodospirillales bacterium]|nr:hypothetical protein [Rhodospirillales bacterium]
MIKSTGLSSAQQTTQVLPKPDEAAKERKTEKNLDQSVQDEINLSRTGELVNKILALPDSDQFAKVLADASDEIMALTEAFGRRLKGAPPQGQNQTPETSFLSEQYQEAVRQTVTDILGGTPPQDRKGGGFSFADLVNQKLDLLTSK